MVAAVTSTGAFAAGALSFVSPCVLPLVPPYLAYMAGIGLNQIRAGSGGVRRRVIFAAVCFVLGFATVFVALGASASLIGGLLRTHQLVFSRIAGVGIIVMGLHFLGIFRIGLLYREARFEAQSHNGGPVASYLMGLAFGFGWTPCIGPVLAAILAVSASQETLGQGALLLAIYSAGLGLPFIIAAAFANDFMLLFGRFKSVMPYVEKLIGVALVVTGLMFLFGGIDRIAYWIMETFPVLGEIG